MEQTLKCSLGAATPYTRLEILSDFLTSPSLSSSSVEVCLE